MVALGQALPATAGERAPHRRRPRSPGCPNCSRMAPQRRPRGAHRHLAAHARDPRRPGADHRHRQRHAAACRLEPDAQRAAHRHLRLRPGGYLGLYMPDAFWFGDSPPRPGTEAMLRYIVRRVLLMIPTLLVTSVLIFTVMQLPPSDYFETYVAEMQAQGERADRGGSSSCAANTGSIAAVYERYLRWIAGIRAGRFRLFLRIRAAGARRRRRPPRPHHAGVVLHDPRHLDHRLPDRHLRGDAPVQHRRLRPHLPRPARHRHPALPAGAGDDVFREPLVRPLDRRADGRRYTSTSR